MDSTDIAEVFVKALMTVVNKAIEERSEEVSNDMLDDNKLKEKVEEIVQEEFNNSEFMTESSVESMLRDYLTRDDVDVDELATKDQISDLEHELEHSYVSNDALESALADKLDNVAYVADMERIDNRVKALEIEVKDLSAAVVDLHVKLELALKLNDALRAIFVPK